MLIRQGFYIKETPVNGMGSPWQQQLQECGPPGLLQLQGTEGCGVQTQPPPKLSMLGKGQSWAYGCSQYWF